MIDDADWIRFSTLLIGYAFFSLTGLGVAAIVVLLTSIWSANR
jgi:hypothetical protein